MRNNRKKTKEPVMAHVTIQISGGQNQIFPNVTELVQNFYGVKPEVEQEKKDKTEKKEEEEEDDATRIARGTLCIYYTDEEALRGIIRRISECRNASDLASLVVNEMGKHTILTEELMVGKTFIEALRHFLTFRTGSSVGNIRTQINNAIRRC